MESSVSANYQILLFYKYVHIANPEQVRDWLFDLCTERGLKGRLIIAKEGLNITLEGLTQATEDFIAALERDERFLNIHFKRSVGTGKAFRKLSVKARPEIVSAHLGVCDIDPNQMTGKRLSPEMLHEWFTQKGDKKVDGGETNTQTITEPGGAKEFYIIDMRNIYEHDLGHFEDAICPPMENFRDLAAITKNLAHLKNKTVLTVCTGGVRCEKASGYLMSQGFTDVWQLDGGIVSYMEKYPNEHFLGKLYVFDNRIGMGFYTDDEKHVVIGKCANCKKSAERFVNCDNVWCGRHFIFCEDCQADAKGKKLCPQGCTVRRVYKVKSPASRLWLKIKQALYNK